jgi:hypothetical protein
MAILKEDFRSHTLCNFLKILLTSFDIMNVKRRKKSCDTREVSTFVWILTL